MGRKINHHQGDWESRYNSTTDAMVGILSFPFELNLQKKKFLNSLLSVNGIDCKVMEDRSIHIINTQNGIGPRTAVDAGALNIHFA